jgi:hypothetical protein
MGKLPGALEVEAGRNPENLRGVMGAGRWLLWEGHVVDQDPEAIRQRVSGAAARLWQA